MESSNAKVPARLFLGLLAGCLAAGAAVAQDGGGLASGIEREIEEFEPRRAKLKVGAGALTYIAQESPSTGFAMDARVAYPLMPIVDAEAALLTGVSQSVDDNTATIPLITEAGVKLNSRQYGPLTLFGTAGLGYGMYFGSEELQDGLSVTMPLGAGVEYQGRNLTVEPRFTYRPVFGDQLGDTEADADSWAALLNVQLPFL